MLRENAAKDGVARLSKDLVQAKGFEQMAALLGMEDHLRSHEGMAQAGPAPHVYDDAYFAKDGARQEPADDAASARAKRKRVDSKVVSVKNVLQEHTQRSKLPLPSYKVTSVPPEEADPSKQLFGCSAAGLLGEVKVGDHVYVATRYQRNRKAAERAAAEAALEALLPAPQHSE